MKCFVMLLFVLLFAGYAQADDFESRLSNIEFNQRKMQQAYDDLSKYNNCTSPGLVSLPMPKGMAEYYARQAWQDIEYYSREMEYDRRMLESDIKQHNRNMEFNQMEFDQRKMQQAYDDLSKYNNCTSPGLVSLPMPKGMAEYYANYAQQVQQNFAYWDKGTQVSVNDIIWRETNRRHEIMIQEIEKREKDMEFEAIRQKPQMQSNNRGKVFKIGTKR